jgi:hypothetical protein
MKKKGWIGFLMGIIFCLLMVMPSSIHSMVWIDGYYSGMINLEDSLPGSDPNPGTRTATVKSGGDLEVADYPALWANANGWSITNNGFIESYHSVGSMPVGVFYGTPKDLNGDLVINNADFLLVDGPEDITTYSGTLTNTGTIYGDWAGVIMGSGTVTNSGVIGRINTPGGYEYSEVGIGFYSDGAITSTVSNSGIIAGYEAGIDFASGGAGTLTVNNSGTIAGYAPEVAGYGVYGGDA